jgi:hypothetical protein
MNNGSSSNVPTSASGGTLSDLKTTNTNVKGGGKRSGGSRNTPLTGVNGQNPKSPSGGNGLLTPTKNMQMKQPL